MQSVNEEKLESLTTYLTVLHACILQVLSSYVCTAQIKLGSHSATPPELMRATLSEKTVSKEKLPL